MKAVRMIAVLAAASLFVVGCEIFPNAGWHEKPYSGDEDDSAPATHNRGNTVSPTMPADTPAVTNPPAVVVYFLTIQNYSGYQLTVTVNQWMNGQYLPITDTLNPGWPDSPLGLECQVRADNVDVTIEGHPNYPQGWHDIWTITGDATVNITDDNISH
jgi:hypothetical protein